MREGERLVRRRRGLRFDSRPRHSAGRRARGRAALAIVARELVVAETESVTVLPPTADATHEPAVRAGFAILVADEVRHAAIGRAVFNLLGEKSCRRAGFGAAARTRSKQMRTDRVEIRRIYRANARGAVGRALGASIAAEDLSWAGAGA